MTVTKQQTEDLLQSLIRIQEALGRFVNDADAYLRKLPESEYMANRGHHGLERAISSAVALMSEAEKVHRQLD